MIDTHSHIDGEEFRDDLSEVIQRAKEAGVDAIFIPGICLKDTPRIFSLCKKYKDILFPMIGLHPENIMDEDYNMVLNHMEHTLQDIYNGNSDLPMPIAIGEVGLDFYWDDTKKAEQEEVFERQINWATKYDLPLMIHSRNAQKELVEIMNHYKQDNLRGVFHCFTGTVEEAKELLAFEGFMLGIGGACTFKKSTLPEVLKESVPLNRIVLETDAPYLTPVPYRGKRNESAYLRFVIDKLADIYNVSNADVELKTTENVSKVFSKCSFFNKKLKFPNI